LSIQGCALSSGIPYASAKKICLSRKMLWRLRLPSTGGAKATTIPQARLERGHLHKGHFLQPIKAGEEDV
jgi:hypothetical protein